ncbi:MAG: ABC transporter ATP-binding protein [Acidobacteriota bacterium]
MIKIVDLYKSFDGNAVLKGVNIDIFDNEVMVILGGSGAGKTVLVKHILGLLKPDRGKIFVDGVDITAIGDDELLKIIRKFGMVFQGAALFDSMNVYENIQFGLKRCTDLSHKEIDKRIKDSLHRVGLKGMERMMPSQLSGGMKKRVGLARAIALEPKFLIYDEPTTGLDPIMADVINNLILKTKNELSITSIIITHDIKSAYKVGDRLSMLYDGRIIEIGVPEEFKNSSNPIVQQFIKGESSGPIEVM